MAGVYPGAQIVVDSERATEWSQELGIDFHEVRIEDNGNNLSLVFSELEVTHVEPG